MSTPEDTGSADTPALQLLPDDVESPQFAEGLQLLKANYADRTSFNHFVCEELARRGIPPNSHNVLKFGRWGQSVAVASDVRSWFAQVSRRLSARHANIPDTCQQQFNALGEQFWALALDHVGKPLKQELLRVQDESTKEVANLQARLDAVTAARDRAEQHLQARISELGDTIEAQERRLQQAAEAAAQGRTELRLALERAVGAERALEQARQDFESRFSALQSAAQADKAAREQAHKEATELLGAANTRLEAQIDQVRREAAAQIDKARQDARGAEDRARQEQARADTARAETESVREQLMKKSVEHARSLRDLELLQAQLQESQQAAAQVAQAEAEQAAKLAREDVLLDLAQSAGPAGIELRVPRTAKRPDWIDVRTWKAFAALANSKSESSNGKDSGQ